MMKKMMRIIGLLLLIIVCNFNNFVYAESEKITYNPNPIDDTPSYTADELNKKITGGELNAYVWGYATKGGVTDRIWDEKNHLGEDYFSTQKNEYRDYAVQRNGKTGAKDADNFSVRYSWLHACKTILNYIQGNSKHTYQWIAKRNDSKYIKYAVEALEQAADNVGTFSGENANAVNEASDNDGVQVRVKKAVKKITGKSKKNLESALRDAKRELMAAYDFDVKKPTYGGEVYILDDFETKSKYTKEQINRYWDIYGHRYGVSKEKGEELKKIWEEATNHTAEDAQEEYDDGMSNTDEDEEYAEEYAQRGQEPKNDLDKETVFVEPKNNTAVASSGPDDVVDDADKFLTEGNTVGYLKTDELQEFSQSIYSILFGIGVIISVIIGLIIGVKLMVAPVGERAEAKKLLIPYAVGCAIVFGAFGLWKLVVIIMQGM